MPSRKRVFGSPGVGMSATGVTSTHGVKVRLSSVGGGPKISEVLPLGGKDTTDTYRCPAASIAPSAKGPAEPTSPGALIVTALSKVWPRSRDTASRTFVERPLNTDQTE